MILRDFPGKVVALLPAGEECQPVFCEVFNLFFSDWGFQYHKVDAKSNVQITMEIYRSLHSHWPQSETAA